MQLVWFENPREELPESGTWEEGSYVPPDRRSEPVCQYRVSKAFEVVDGRRMPLWLELESGTTLENIDEPSWGARVELTDGVPKIANIGFESVAACMREVKSSDFQRLRSAIYVFYAAFCADIDSDGNPVYRIDDAEADRRIAEFLERRRTGRQRLKTEDYKRAAQIYRANFDGTPTQAVADTFAVGIRQGGNIVAECRRRGFLPPTKQGRKKV